MSVAPVTKTFLYFAYGSNLLAQRIHINNPSAQRFGIGKLHDFRLDFGAYSERWKGAVATIVAEKGACVWGAVWRIDVRDMPSLDRQEGVRTNQYFPLDVEVSLASNACCNRTYTCRVYQQYRTEASGVIDLANLPLNRRPSPAYLRTIQLGAEESRLPEDYKKYLAAIADNGYEGDIENNLKLLTDKTSTTTNNSSNF